VKFVGQNVLTLLNFTTGSIDRKHRSKWKIARIICLIFALSLSFFRQVHAQDPISLGFEYGNAKEDITTIQLNFYRDISRWFDERVVNLQSRGIKTGLALTAFNWDHENNEIFGSSVGFKFNYAIPFLITRRVSPFVEYELGTALISETRIGDRNLSTVFHFKNQLGLGLKMNWGSLFVRVSHFSNGRLRQPNDGIDILSAGVMFTY